MAFVIFAFHPTTIIIALAIIVACLTTIYLLHRKKIGETGHALRLTTEMAAKIIESAPDVIYIVDRSYTIQKVFNYNPEIVPTPLNELLGQFTGQFIDPIYVPDLTTAIDQAFASGDTQEVFYTITVSNTVSYFNGYAKRITDNLVACRERNITNAKLYEQRLIHAKEDIEKIQKVNQLILDHSNSGLVYIDKDFTVQFENLQTTFKDASSLKYEKGIYCYQRVKGKDKPCKNCIALKALSSGKVEKTDLTVHNDLIFEITASPIIASDGIATGVVMKYDNITIREKTAQALLEAKKTAETSDRLKSQFLSNMSHEIRTPLNAIVGFSDLLMYTEGQEEKEEYISIIKRNNELLLQLINDILDLSRIESDRMEFVYKDVNINELFVALEAGGNLRAVENPNVRVIFNAPQDNYLIHTEVNRVQQVLANFINNAIKFTDEGTIEIGYEIREENIYFYVSDTGKGIPQEKINEVFKRFVKLNEFANGTGLGLSICQTIIEKLEGEIGVNSTEGKGSTFWFTLPIKATKIETPHVAATPKPEQHDELPSHTATPVLLIAEDEEDNYLLYKTLLKGKFSILHAWNGIEAVELYEANKKSISAIIMDIKMPKMDGYEAVKVIRSQDNKIPIIAASAYALSEDIDKIMKSGFTTYISKPIRNSKLYHILSEVIPNK